MMEFDGVIYGPVRSRRLGLSLGVNLLPRENKVCTFECVYCECGFRKKGVAGRMPSREEVRRSVEEALEGLAKRGERLDVITFAGNGEPTMHPDFEGVIEDTMRARDRWQGEAKISVLSNATMLGRESVRRGLMMADNNILKLDSAIDETARAIDAPWSGDYSVERVVEQMGMFGGDFVLQTMMLRGEVDGRRIDNTTEAEAEAWRAIVRRLRPRQTMVYSIDRETPVRTLEKVGKEEMERIVRPLREEGFDVLVV